MSQHTPAPWVCYADLPSADPNWHIVTSASKTRVIANVHIEPGNPRDEANARLIAAAPDLLESLQAVVAIADRSTDEFDRARAAIAKATTPPKEKSL